MSDSISRIPNITPAYPVRPAQPVHPDKHEGEKKKQQQPAQEERPSNVDDADPENPTIIDELV